MGAEPLRRGSQSRRDVARALELDQQALAVNRELGKPDDEAIALEGTGKCLLAWGRR